MKLNRADFEKLYRFAGDALIAQVNTHSGMANFLIVVNVGTHYEMIGRAKPMMGISGDPDSLTWSRRDKSDLSRYPVPTTELPTLSWPEAIGANHRADRAIKAQMGRIDEAGKDMMAAIDKLTQGGLDAVSTARQEAPAKISNRLSGLAKKWSLTPLK